MAPVMAIAMLSNAPTNLEKRDEWIGWTPEQVIEALSLGNADAGSLMSSLVQALDRAIGMIRADDLVSPAELTEPTPATVTRLLDIGKEAAAKRLETLHELEEHDTRTTRHLPTTPDGAIDWKLTSESPLFVRKRADTLAALLRAKLAFQKSGVWCDPVSKFQMLAGSAEGRKAIAIALREVRKVALASGLMDVSVCGAVPPYGELLGGKLVAMLLGSKEIDAAYRERYGQQVSVIASQMKGAPVTRTAELMVLTTTSLYGVASSQYNRLVLRRHDHPELDYDLVWSELGVTKGFGTAHLSKATVSALRALSRKVHGARRVNNLFGEGTSPRLRQIREGLEVLGVQSDALLEHSNPRILYAIELIPGARRTLIGMESELPQRSKPGAGAISAAWLRRWALRRIGNEEVIARIETLRRQHVQEQLQTINTQLQFEL